MSSAKQACGGGMSIATGLFMVFLVLKLCEIGTVATWSWWWVTAPLWAPWAALLGILAVVFVSVFIGASVASLVRRIFRGKTVKL